MVDIKIDTSNLEQGAEQNGQGIDLVPRSQASEFSTTINEKQSGLLTVPGKEMTRSGSISSAGSSSNNHWEDEAGVNAKGEDRATVLASAREVMETHDGENSGPFAFNNRQLQALVDPKNLEVLRQMGGLQGLAKGLASDLQSGLSWDETVIPVHITLEDAVAAADGASAKEAKAPAVIVAPPTQGISKKPTIGGIKRTITMRSTMKADEDKMQDRKRIFSTNVLPTRKTKNIFQLMWIALQDKVLILLSVAAVISLALGLYETFGEEPELDALGNPIPQLDWVEGVAIVVAIAIVTIVGSANDYQKERQFVKLNKKVNAFIILTTSNNTERRPQSHRHSIRQNFPHLSLRRGRG
jgi:Ca2+-transporting ATPase